MTCLCFRMKTIVFLLGIVILLFAGVSDGGAQNDTLTTLSGRVVDEAGNPVPDIVIGIKSYKGNFLPHRYWMNILEPVFPPPRPSDTDATGAFSIDNIVSPSINQLLLFPERDPEYEIRAIETQGIIFYVHLNRFHFNWSDGFPFDIEEETDIKDVKITVRLRMWIRGQVLSADGAPLSNARVNLKIKRRDVNGDRGSSRGTKTLDADGHFTRYVNYPAYYTISVTYQGQSAESKEILLEEGQRFDGLTLTLSGDPEPSPKPKVAVRRIDPERRRAAWKRPREEDVWAINPANRHAYQRIYCQTPEEALVQATARGAHLVAINDIAEQQWILEVFGKENHWIGLTEGLKEGNKQWDNGDPVTYTNWESQPLIPEPDKSAEKDEKTIKKFTVLIGLTGKWQQACQGSPVASITKRAILEREYLIIGMPKPDEGTE